eukprot:scaffold247180_cov43-Prasinocladus_malaysianus.AAC.3
MPHSPLYSAVLSCYRSTTVYDIPTPLMVIYAVLRTAYNYALPHDSARAVLRCSIYLLIDHIYDIVDTRYLACMRLSCWRLSAVVDACALIKTGR